MKNNSTYKIFPDMGVYVLSLYGPTSIRNILLTMKAVRENRDFNVGMTGLADLRKACFIFRKEDIIDTEFSQPPPGFTGKRKIAVIADASQQTTYSLVYKSLESQMTVSIEVFTSIESGMDWLSIPREHFNAINTHLLNAEIDYHKALV